MDKFLTFRRDIKSGGFIGDVAALNAVATALDEPGSLVCIHGPTGVGKSHIISTALKGCIWVEVERVRDIPPTLEASPSHVVVDCSVVDKGLLDILSTRRGSLSKGATIIACNEVPHSLPPNAEVVQMLPLPIATLEHILKKSNPGMDTAVSNALARGCGGDLRTLMFSAKFPDTRDNFPGSKEWLFDMMCREVSNPMEMIGVNHCEHGHIFDLVHSNIYTGCKELNPEIADLISTADVFDSDNTWELINYFWLTGVYHPIMLMDRKIPDCSMKPGTAWTKFSNHKMREKRLRHLPDRDTLMMLQMMDDPHMYAAYGVTPSQYDTIHNISFNMIKKNQATRKELDRILVSRRGTVAP